MLKWISAGVVAFATLSAWPAAATPYTTHPVVGGVGDRDGPPMVCPDSHPLLTGFFGRVGDWMDQIGILCSEVLPGWKTGQVTKDEYRGGSGGAKVPLATCNANSGIRWIEIGIGYNNGTPKHVMGVSFKCYRPSSGAYTSKDDIGARYFRDTPYDERRFFQQTCRGSEYAVGLDTRWGTHVNAAGLICAKLKPPAPAPFILIPIPGSGGPGAPGGGAPGSPMPAPPPIPEFPQGSKPGEALNEGMENDTDRPGSDIHRFELQDANPGVCQARCAKLDRCKAWTYVRPGVQGPKAVCYLKDGAPQAAPNKCCVSGVKPNRTSPGALREPDGFAAAGARRCKPGFVWREARPSDVVCVTPESRAMVGQENAVAPSRWDPSGAYGPNTCIAGFVWREAFDGDVVCVTPERRAAVKEENRVGPSRTE